MADMQNDDDKRITPAYLERAAVAYLERYASSLANLRRVLIRKVRRRSGAAPDADILSLIEQVVAKTARSGLIDDHRYADAKLHALLSRGASIRAAAAKLAAKGLDQQVVAAAMDEAAPTTWRRRAAMRSVAVSGRSAPSRPLKGASGTLRS